MRRAIGRFGTLSQRSVQRPPSLGRPQHNQPGGSNWDAFGKPVLFATGFSAASFVGFSALEAYRVTHPKPRDYRQQEYASRFMAMLMGPGGSATGFVLLSNIAVFGLWTLVAPKNAQVLRLMDRFFMANPSASTLFQHIGSAFSHRSFWHIAANMFAFVSFGAPIARSLGAEHFMSFFLSSAVFSSVFSRSFAILAARAGIANTMQPSLGASCAVMATFALFAQAYPHSKLVIIFLPFWPFEAGGILHTLTGIELCLFVFAFFGVRFLPFDHAGHLSGLLFGWMYFDSYQSIQKTRLKIRRYFEPIMSTLP